MIVNDRWPFISIIVPLFNEAARLPALMCALRGQDYPLFEVLLVDNDSTDATFALACEFVDGRVRVLRETSRQTPDAARNAGIRAAQGELLAFTDADCAPEPGWLRGAALALAAGAADMAAGRIDFDLRLKPSAGELYDAVSFLQHSTSVADRGIAFTANLVVRRTVTDAVGLFPVDIGWNGDALFTRRAVNAGFRLVYAEQAAVRHPARPLGALLGKAWRIAYGKGWFRDTAPSPGVAAPRPVGGARAFFIEPKPHLRHLHPLLLRRALLRREPALTGATWARTVVVAWSVAAIGALGFGAGRLARAASAFGSAPTPSAAGSAK